MMELKQYDEKLVRITDIFGDVFEGFCEYYTSEMNDVIYGREEESLKIICYDFYRDVIQDVEILENFSGPYGLLEEDAAEADALLVEEILESEMPDHIERMLRCLERYLDPSAGLALKEKDQIINSLRVLARSADDEDIRAHAQCLADRFEKQQNEQ